MDIKQFIDSTYLKTPNDVGISVLEDEEIVKNCIQEAIDERFKLIMIRNNHINLAKNSVKNANSNLLIGTVIDFPFGNSSIENKIEEAKIAIEKGADELDFVINYIAFKNNEIELIKKEVLICTKLCLKYNKTIKWIIEVAALTDEEIISISKLIKEVVSTNFDEKDWQKVFVKSSTGFYKTENNLPNGATIHSIKLMVENAKPLPIKAAGGVSNFTDALEMINLGVSRIGTSNSKKIIYKINSTGY